MYTIVGGIIDSMFKPVVEIGVAEFEAFQNGFKAGEDSF